MPNIHITFAKYLTSIRKVRGTFAKYICHSKKTVLLCLPQTTSSITTINNLTHTYITHLSCTPATSNIHQQRDTTLFDTRYLFVTLKSKIMMTKQCLRRKRSNNDDDETTKMTMTTTKQQQQQQQQQQQRRPRRRRRTLPLLPLLSTKDLG